MGEHARPAPRAAQLPVRAAGTWSVSDAVAHGRRTLETELNASGDNPLVVPEWNAVLANGNFRPAGLSITFDTLAIALAQVMSMAVNRILRLRSIAVARASRRAKGALAGGLPGSVCCLNRARKLVEGVPPERRVRAVMPVRPT
jgi:hypothetical protein